MVVTDSVQRIARPPAGSHVVHVVDDASTPARRHSPEHGDRAHGTGQPKGMSCTNFKASLKTKPSSSEPNYLHHAKEGASSYQQELKHGTTV